MLVQGCVLDARRAATKPGVENADLGIGDTWSDPDPQTPARLEECWGPGRTIGLMTGTWASKDRNFAVNVPLASWYIREEDRKGYGLLGGALAYDTVSVDRVQGRPVSKSLWSHGLLGLFGRVEKRDLDGGGEYSRYHWFFPFYRYVNHNGERTVYPLFLFPVSLAPDPRPMLEVPPWEENTLGDSMLGDPIDPPEVTIPPAPPPGEVAMRPALPRNPRSPDSSLQSMTDMLKESRNERTRRATQRMRARARAPEPRASTARGSSTLARGSWHSTGTAASAATASPSTASPSAAPPSAGMARTYRVRAGDTLSSIARREYGSASQWRTIHDANRGKIPNPDRIGKGMVLTLPAR